MSNYYAWTKTNWFRVNNEFTFKHILSQLVVFGCEDNSLIHKSYEGKDGYFYHKLMCYGDIVGPYNEATGDYEDIEEVLYKPLQRLLPSNEDVFVLKYAGVEDLKLIDSGYTIVTKEDIVYSHIDRIIDEEVEELVGSSNIIIDFGYKDSATEYIINYDKEAE